MAAEEMAHAFPDPPRDAETLVAASAKLREPRGGVDGGEASRVGTLRQILSLLRAPTLDAGADAHAPNASPKRLRQRCAWALDFGVVDDLVTVMMANPDCVHTQAIACTILADVAQAFVETNDGRSQIASGTDSVETIDDAPRFDVSGVITQARVCAEMLSRGASCSKLTQNGNSKQFNAQFLDTHLKHACVFRELDRHSRRVAMRSAKLKKFLPGERLEVGCFAFDETFGTENTEADTVEHQATVYRDRALVVLGEVLITVDTDTRRTLHDAGGSKKTEESFGEKCDRVVQHCDELSTDLDAPLLESDPRNSKSSYLAATAFPPRVLSGGEIGVDALSSRLRETAEDGAEANARRRGKYIHEIIATAGPSGCALLIVPGTTLEACALGNAVADGLKRFSFFEDGDGEEGEEEKDMNGKEEEDDDEGTNGKQEEPLETHKNTFPQNISAIALSSRERLARQGAAAAVLHTGLRCAGVCLAGVNGGVGGADTVGVGHLASVGKQSPETSRQRESARLALALSCFRFVAAVASEKTNRKLGADGAMDRLVATVHAFPGNELVEVAAGAAMKALVRGNEQNMRMAFSLGKGDVVW